jgi:thioredoxin 2
MAVIRCPSCGAQNRVEDRGPGLRPVCGRCQAPLPAPEAAAHPIEVTDADFGERVLRAGPQPVLVDFWAEWCPPCRQLAPTIDRLAAEAAGRYQVAKLDVEKSPRTAEQYGVQSIPTLLIFKNGSVVEQLVGPRPKEEIAARLAAHAQ